MTLVAVNTTPATCPDCGGTLSMPLGSKARPGMVVQTCKNYQACGRAVWSSMPVTLPPVIDDGSRHGRMFRPSTSEPEPAPLNTKPNWTSVGRMASRELAEMNKHDRKLAAAGGDR